ncbi:hypothetical protein [Desulfonatronovibrio hydrogenovorans]|uniref:hypothetical protein n=1 Tax=Desulfonatronovibrio hydrogenovorans TaxID=53245 RepID=UPI00048B39AE|nr:hypothetical protein [Desulfonatronovibrio hydrogenovorans]
MNSFEWIILVVSGVEIILLILVFLFFYRLRKSENLLAAMQKNQHAFIEKLNFNSQLEQELVSTFEQRQKELINLEAKMDERIRELNRLVRQAEKFTASPQFMRNIIISGYKNGRSIEDLTKATGLSRDEIELIIDGH